MSQESSWIAKNMASPGKGGKGQYKRMKTKEKVYLPALVVAVLVGVFVCVWEWWVGEGGCKECLIFGFYHDVDNLAFSRGGNLAYFSPKKKMYEVSQQGRIARGKNI